MSPMGLTFPPFTYYVDPELRLVHLFFDCSGLKMARRYSYKTECKIRTLEDAVYLDLQGRPCHSCWKREKHWSLKDGRKARPGFRAEPRP